jgi:hypothetical protein
MMVRNKLHRLSDDKDRPAAGEPKTYPHFRGNFIRKTVERAGFSTMFIVFPRYAFDFLPVEAALAERSFNDLLRNTAVSR